jgi:hypothetical protein
LGPDFAAGAGALRFSFTVFFAGAGFFLPAAFFTTFFFAVAIAATPS